MAILEFKGDAEHISGKVNEALGWMRQHPTGDTERLPVDAEGKEGMRVGRRSDEALARRDKLGVSAVNCVSQKVETISGSVPYGYVPRIEGLHGFSELHAILSQAGFYGLHGAFDGVEAVIETEEDGTKIVPVYTLPQGSLQASLAHGDL